jgi:mono/diheme cytochrome c family protein
LQIVEGYNPGQMPNFAEILDQTEVEDLVAYIMSLR